jgi:hypothetical protein
VTVRIDGKKKDGNRRRLKIVSNLKATIAQAISTFQRMRGVNPGESFNIRGLAADPRFVSLFTCML